MKVSIILMIDGGIVFVSGLLWLIFGSSESKTADSQPAKSQPSDSQPAKSVQKHDSKTKRNNFEDYVANNRYPLISMPQTKY